jgi:hypothetical protein
MAISLILSSSFAFLQSLVQSTLAAPPQRSGSSHGLCFPSARPNIEGPLVVGLPDPLPFRLQGLVTLLAVFSLRRLADLFQTGSAHGIYPSESYPPPGSGPLPAGMAHVPFAPAVVADVPVGPAGQVSASGLCPRWKFPSSSAGLGRQCREAPMGFAPSRVIAKASTGMSPDLLSRALSDPL